MMNEILFPVILVSGIALILGIILAVASVIMAVPKNERVKKLIEILPKANCGSCGYSGCEGYAEALSKGEAKTNLCLPGGIETIKNISKILGVNETHQESKVAVVRCLGFSCNTDKRINYEGIKSCVAASQLCGSIGNCSYGCIGFGDCLKSCPFNAISICDGVAVIDKYKCNACGKCISVCPKSIIKMHKNDGEKAFVYCSSKSTGAITRKACIVGCIGCMRCVKECEYGAIKVENNLAVIDSQKCVGCKKCMDVCKPGCIRVFDGV